MYELLMKAPRTRPRTRPRKICMGTPSARTDSARAEGDSFSKSHFTCLLLGRTIWFGSSIVTCVSWKTSGVCGFLGNFRFAETGGFCVRFQSWEGRRRPMRALGVPETEHAGRAISVRGDLEPCCLPTLGAGERHVEPVRHFLDQRRGPLVGFQGSEIFPLQAAQVFVKAHTQLGRGLVDITEHRRQKINGFCHVGDNGRG